MTSIGRWLLALTAIGQVATSLPPAFPRPNATKLVETDRIVVWDIVWPKDQPSPLHRHVFDQVGTYYQSGGRAITSLNGARSEATTPVGNISTTRKGTTHVEEGTTDPPLRAVFIEMKFDTAANPGTDRSVASARTNRAMPPTKPGSLTPDEVYALVALLLYRNGITQESDSLDAQSLPKIEMPNRNGFVPAVPVWPPVPKKPSWY